MSNLIDMPDQYEQAPYEDFKLKLKLIFRAQVFLCKNVEEKPRQITFWIKSADNIFGLSTCWRFRIVGHTLVIEVSVYNQNEDDLLRVRTDRMKIQLSVLLNEVNNQIRSLLPSTWFLVDYHSGVLKLIEHLPVAAGVEVGKMQLSSCVQRLFSILRRFQQLPKFLQPLFNLKQLTQQEMLQHPANRLNRLRCLLLNTGNRRTAFMSQVTHLVNLRAGNYQFTHDFVSLSNIYMANVVEFQLSQIGLKGIDYIVSKQQLGREIHDKERNQRAKTTAQNKELDKILNGLVHIQPSKKTEEQNDSHQDKAEGGHSEIQSKRFEYYVADTIYAETVDEYMQQDQRHAAKKKQGFLTFKVCNTNIEVAINSFKNQLAFLRHVRDMSSPFVARYFLLVKQKWDQKDTIYMTTYKKNVYNLITHHSTMKIGSKLDLAYKIAKSLCFLFSAEILHRDFKPQNVVVDSFLTPKLIDFGSCISHFKQNHGQKKFQTYEERLISTPSYQVYYKDFITKKPHLHLKYPNKRRFDEHPLFDVYSFGRTLSFIFFGKLAPSVSEAEYLSPYGQFYQYLIFLIEMCLNIDPDERPSFGQITAYIQALADLITVSKIQQDSNKNKSQNKDEKRQITSGERTQRKTSKKEEQKPERKQKKDEKKTGDKLPRTRK